MLFRACPPETRSLLGVQLVFDLGLCAVLPFLAGAVPSGCGPVATCGGIAVPAGSTALGQPVETTDRSGWWAGAPRVPLILLALVSALALPRVLPAPRAPQTSASPSAAHHDERVL